MELFKLFGTIAVNNDEANRAIAETGDRARDTADDIEDLGNEGGKSESKLKKAFGKIGSAALKVGKVVGTGLLAGGAAVAKLTQSAVTAYADYEQLVGGVETLFKNSSKKVIEYANNAYKTAGMSANEYMETVTSFSASLLQSMGGDTAKAADKANLAITDMSDNANKMGTDMSLIQNAYQGFAKQNYTMLDNLKLGYGGTKEEMQRLLKDAEKLSGQKFDLSSYGDIVDAIHIVQTQMGITGTTAKEASSTIQGSVGMMKASWSNLVVGLADDTQDFDQLLSNFIESVGTVADNLIPRIEVALNGIVKLIQGLAPKIAAMLPGLVSSILPGLLSAATDLINALVAALPGIIDAISAIIPMLLEALISITNALIEALPTLITSIVSFLVANIPVILDAAIQLLNALIDAIPIIIDALIPQLPTIVTAIADALVKAIPQILEAAVKLFMAIVKAIPQILSALGAALKALLASIMKPFEPIVNWFKELWGNVKNAIISVIAPIGEFFSNLWEGIKNAVQVAIMFIGSIISAAWNIITLPFRAIWENCKDDLIAIWETIKSTVSTAIETVKTVITNVMNAIKAFLTPIWNAIKTVITTVVNAIKTRISNVFNAIKTTITKIITGVKTKVTTVFNAIKTAILTPLNAAKTTVSNIFNGIKTTISNVINSAKNIVSSGLNAIKNFFSRLTLKFPHIKLPHFSVSGSFSLSPPSVPKLGVEWYAKAMDNAMLLNAPTIFGAKNGNLLGGGEVGQEVVSGANTLMNMIQNAVQGENIGINYQLDKISSILSMYLPEIIDKSDKQIVLNDGTLVGSMATKMDEKLGSMTRMRVRGN